MTINRELREALLQHTKRRRFRVHMLKKSEEELRKGIGKTLQLEKCCKVIKKESKELCPKCTCSRKCLTSAMHELFPFVRIMQRYSLRKYLLYDLIAGLTVGIIHIPQGMAYGFLSQLPPVYGLYTSFFPVLLYFFFGSSKHVSIGTFAVVSLLVGTVVQRGNQLYGSHTIVGNAPGNLTAMAAQNMTALSDPSVSATRLHPAGTASFHGTHTGYADPVKIGFAMSVTFVAGCFQLLLGALRLGFMASFMSDPFISGFTTGAAVHVFSSQIKHIFGVRVHHYHGPLKLIYFYSEFFLNVLDTNMVTLTASLTCILILVLIKEGINNNETCRRDFIMPIPIELLVIAVATIVSHYTRLNKDFAVQIVGEIPKGLPAPTVTHFRYIPEVLGDGIIIGFIAYAITFSMAKILADKHGYKVNANQEIVALGVCNFVSSFFSCYCCSASLSRSLVQDSAGGKTQVVGLISSFMVLIVLLYIGPLFEDLPECILASIVIVTLKGMFLQFRDPKRLWGLCKRDFAVWLVTFIAVVLLDVALGLLIGIVFSLYFVLRHSQKPHMCMLGQVPGTGAYADVTTSQTVKQIDNIKIFRFEASIYFANAEHFRDRLYEKTSLVPRRLKKKKRRAMHLTLIRRKNELEQAERERKKERERKNRGVAIELVVHPASQQPIDEAEEQEKKSRESKLILDRFTKAWQPPIKTLIIDLSVVKYIDSVAVKILTQIVHDYKDVGIRVFLAGCKPDVRNMLRQADFYGKIGYSCIYFTVHEAVVIAQEVEETEKKKKTPSPSDVKLLEDVEAKPEEEEEQDEDEEYDTSPEDMEEEMEIITHKAQQNEKETKTRTKSKSGDSNFEMVDLN